MESLMPQQRSPLSLEVPAFELGLMALTKFSKIGIGNMNALWFVRSLESSIAGIAVHATARYLIPLPQEELSKTS